MTIDVSDFPSNSNDQIVFAARTIGRSPQRKKVFLAIYTGKKTKTVSELMQLTGLSRVRVLQETGKLADIIKQDREGKESKYTRIPQFMRRRNEILKLAGNEQAISKVATKTNPKTNIKIVNLSIPKKMVDIKQITIDEIDSFEKVRIITEVPENSPLLEKRVKIGVQKILKEPGDFLDWGGETDDLFSTRLLLNKERKAVAFGFKGRATQGILTPKKMGINGDQIQRLFRAPAEVFFVQYWNTIDESIIDQMKICAICKSVSEGRRIYYGIIDGQDTARLMLAYPEFFE
ncbi:MAG: hypothetical protein ACM3UN_03335 [Bacillota bacterium]